MAKVIKHNIYIKQFTDVCHVISGNGLKTTDSGKKMSRFAFLWTKDQMPAEIGISSGEAREELWEVSRSEDNPYEC